MQSLETSKLEQVVEVLYRTIANGNEEAYRFILGWQSYCHGIDDAVDGDIKDPESIIAIFFTAAAVYNSNYWVRHKDTLYTTVALITNDYADSNIPDMPQADFLRGTGNNMLKAIAHIEGGYELMRKISPMLNKLSYNLHHDSTTGKPI